MNEDRENLVALFKAATSDELAEGMSWYWTAHGEAARIAADNGLTIPVVSAVIGALSPRCKWARNLVDAESMCKAHKNGFDPFEVSVCTFHRNKRRAADILAANDPSLLSGPKVTAFARTIADPTTLEIVVDSHAFNAFVGERAISGGKGPRIHKARLVRTSDAYVNVAEQFGIIPWQCQAVVWLVWKRIYNL